jgi:hypothetical protein
MSATMLTGRVGWEEEGKDTSAMRGGGGWEGQNRPGAFKDLAVIESCGDCVPRGARKADGAPERPMDAAVDRLVEALVFDAAGGLAAIELVIAPVGLV